MTDTPLTDRNKVYFASDFHLGTDGKHTSREREAIIVRWLRSVAADAQAIYLVGDIFDYWYEYKHVIPKGHSRFLAELRRVVDSGVEVHFFTGNHDVWMYDYFTEEYGIPIHRSPQELNLQGRQLLVAHGDGLGPGDIGYKLIKKIFTNKLCQWLWSRLHPNFALAIMKGTSSTSRKYTDDTEEYDGPEGEWLTAYAERKQQQQVRDYYVFGHRHVPIDHTLSDGKGRYINLGDWLHNYTYAVLESGQLTLKKLDI